MSCLQRQRSGMKCRIKCNRNALSFMQGAAKHRKINMKYGILQQATHFLRDKTTAYKR